MKKLSKAATMVIKKASAYPLSSTTPLSASRALLVYLLLFNIGSLASARCRTYSCGPLQDIDPPFRSKGDPHKCGDPRYQLACVDGNKTIWDIHQAGTYYVTNIRDFSFTVVDADLVNGSCSLPLQSLSRTSIEKMGFSLEYFTWATFVSCSRKRVNSAYNPVPCLSKADAFVYVILSLEYGLQLKYAECFCSFLAMTPITFDSEQMEWLDGSNIISLKHPKTDVFQLLKRGFPVVFLDLTFRDCLKEVKCEDSIDELQWIKEARLGSCYNAGGYRAVLASMQQRDCVDLGRGAVDAVDAGGFVFSMGAIGFLFWRSPTSLVLGVAPGVDYGSGCTKSEGLEEK